MLGEGTEEGFWGSEKGSYPELLPGADSPTRPPQRLHGKRAGGFPAGCQKEEEAKQ